MALQVGDVVFPLRAFIGPKSRSYGLENGKPGYDEDELVDVLGERRAQVIIEIDRGNMTLVRTFFDPSSATTPRYIVFNPTMWAALTTYVPGNIVATNAGQLFECAVGGGGVSGGSAPTTSGADGTVTWTELLGPPSPSGERYAPWRNSTIYQVQAWDIEVSPATKSTTTAFYPEWNLQVPLTFEQWLTIGADPASMSDPNLALQLTNPTFVLPRVTVEHVDLGAPPEAVASLARAMEIAGVTT